MRIIGLALAAVLLAARPGAAAVHGLVIGIDDYPHHSQLGGAANDAQDMADVLKKIVTGKLEILINGAATRAAFDAAWSSIVAQSARDDVIVLHFSGHGIKDTDDDVYRDEEDGYDEFFLFQPFAETGPNANEKIRDDELFQLFTAAHARGINVLFVADACHSGGLVRDIGAQSAKGRKGPAMRFTRFTTKIARPAPPRNDFRPKPEIPDNVVFLGATHEARPVEEVYIENKPRGVLTYYAARALEGVADKDHNGALSVQELFAYLQPNIRERSRNRQVPILVATNKQLAIPAATRSVAPSDDSGEIALAVVGDATPPALSGARLVADTAEAELIWDAGQRELSNASGDVLASNVGPGGLQPAVDARRLRAYLLGLMQDGHVLPVELLPGDALYSKGCQVEYRVDTFDYPHFTVVNLAANGTIQFLFPLEQFKDPIKWARPDGWNVRTRVSAPFGADFLIFIASEDALVGMHKELAPLNASQDPRHLETVLKKWLPSTRFQIGLKGAFTSAEGESCGS